MIRCCQPKPGSMGKIRYKKAIYSVELEISKSPVEVFNQLIDLAKWWPEDFEGEDVRLYSEFILTIGDSHYSKNKVIEFVPNQKLIWLTTESNRKLDNYDWTGTKMIFELDPKGDGTELKFTYDGVVPEDELERLKQICDLCVKEMFYNYVERGETK